MDYQPDERKLRGGKKKGKLVVNFFPQAKVFDLKGTLIPVAKKY